MILNHGGVLLLNMMKCDHERREKPFSQDFSTIDESKVFRETVKYACCRAEAVSA